MVLLSKDLSKDRQNNEIECKVQQKIKQAKRQNLPKEKNYNVRVPIAVCGMGHCSSSQLLKLDKIQKYAMRLITSSSLGLQTIEYYAGS